MRRPEKIVYVGLARLGWRLMGVPWLSTASMERASIDGWHWRLYRLGAGLHDWAWRQSTSGSPTTEERYEA